MSWVEARRASQLSIDYRMDIHRVADWFKWEEMKTARSYIGTSGEIKDMMLKANPSWN